MTAGVCLRSIINRMKPRPASRKCIIVVNGDRHRLGVTAQAAAAAAIRTEGQTESDLARRAISGFSTGPVDLGFSPESGDSSKIQGTDVRGSASKRMGDRLCGSLSGYNPAGAGWRRLASLEGNTLVRLQPGAAGPKRRRDSASSIEDSARLATAGRNRQTSGNQSDSTSCAGRKAPVRPKII
jgi:hypothetical protein